jgi:hypothetical protein
MNAAEIQKGRPHHVRAPDHRPRQPYLASAQPQPLHPRVRRNRRSPVQSHRERLDPAGHHQPGAAARRADHRQHVPHRPGNRRPAQGWGTRRAHHRGGVLAGRPPTSPTPSGSRWSSWRPSSPRTRSGSASTTSCAPGHRFTTTTRRSGRSPRRSARCASSSPSLSSASRSLARKPVGVISSAHPGSG